jgi:hypothetical protein
LNGISDWAMRVYEEEMKKGILFTSLLLTTSLHTFGMWLQYMYEYFIYPATRET